jgi:type II secretory pathway pseudopilin PulG
MEPSKHIDTAVAGIALVTAAATTMYAYRKAQELHTELEVVQTAIAALAKQAGTNGAALQAIGSRTEHLNEGLKSFKVTLANQISSVQDLEQELEDHHAGVTEWAAAITAELRAARPDATIPDLFIGAPIQAPPARRGGGRREVHFQRRAPPAPARRQRDDRAEDEEEEDDPNLAMIRKRSRK